MCVCVCVCVCVCAQTRKLNTLRYSFKHLDVLLNKINTNKQHYTRIVHQKIVYFQ